MEDQELIIKRCIKRSEIIIKSKAANLKIKNAEFFLNRIPTLFPSQKHLKPLQIEIDNFIDSLEKEISRYLKPIFKNNNINIKDKFWFSSNDLQSGYIFLKNQTQVLFLSPTKEEIGNAINPGDILPYERVKSILLNVLKAQLNVNIETKYANETLNQENDK